VDNALRSSWNTEEGVVNGTCISREFVPAVGIDKVDGILVPSPHDGPIGRVPDVLLHFGGILDKLEFAKLVDGFRSLTFGCKMKVEHFVEVNKPIGNDVAPQGSGEVWASGIGKYFVADKRRTTCVVCLEFESLSDVFAKDRVDLLFER
jgi:hypothetical protein